MSDCVFSTKNTGTITSYISQVHGTGGKLQCVPHTRISDTCLKKKCSISKAEDLRAKMSGLVSNNAAEFEILQVSDVYVLLLGGGIYFGPCLIIEIAPLFSCFCGMNL